MNEVYQKSKEIMRVHEETDMKRCVIQCKAKPFFGVDVSSYLIAALRIKEVKEYWVLN